jgi:polyisoprenoid-binding protein YceI
MKRTALAVALAAPLAAAAQAESYTIDPIHSFVYFSIDHLGINAMHGRFNKSAGKFTIDRAGKKGTLELTIEAGSIDTGDNDKGSRPRSRDEHLRSPDFFNVAEFPRITYRATGVKFAGDNPAEIEGQLTMLGVSKPVTLKVDRWSCRDHPMSKRPMCGGNVSATFKRSDFGMKYGIPAIGDDIRLLANVEAFKDQ